MNQNRKNSWRMSLRKYLKSTRFLTLDLVWVGFIAWLIPYSILYSIYGSRSIPDVWRNLCMMLLPVPMFCGGLFAMKRREISRVGLPNIKGLWAVIIGAATVITTGLGIVALLFFTIQSMIE